MLFKRINKFYSAFQSTFYAKELTIELNQNPKKIDVNNEILTFGAVETDHILEVLYDDQSGWHAPKIKPFGPLQIHPFNTTLHYALSCFEGMKAYKGSNGDLRLFRPERNIDRFLRSCEKVGLPQFDKEEFLSLLKAFV